MVEEREDVRVGEPTIYNCIQCSSKFKHKFSLTRHIKTIHTWDEYKCDKCESSFGRRGVLARHKFLKHTLQKCGECDFTTNEKCGLEHHMLGINPPETEILIGKSALCETCFSMEETFKVRTFKVKVRTFKVVEGKYPLNALKDYDVKIKKILKKMLERGKTVKSYIGMKIRMKKSGIDEDNIKNHLDVWFEGGIRALNSETCVDLLCEVTRENIMEDFGAYNENGDGWVFERVVNLQLHTVKYNSTNKWKYIPTPKFIDHAVVNIKNEEDDCCFLWSIIAALSSKDRGSFNDPTNIEYYKMMKHKHNLKFGGITSPIKMEDIPEWEEMNDIPIAVYGVEENGEEVYPLYYTKRRDKKPINLLVIEGEENYHYAWIKNFDCLMTCEEIKQNDGEYSTCQCMMYRAREEFIQPRWLLDGGVSECLVGEEVQMDEDVDLVEEIEDLLDMESDAFAHS